MPERIYELKGLAGKGGMSAVYFAAEKKTGQMCVFKVPVSAGNPSNLQREANIQARISCRKVPKVYRCTQIEGKFGLLMEYRQGRTLEECLEEDGGFSEAEVLCLGMAICKILIYMHTRNPPVYYLDMKPSNILVKGKQLEALVDFGCALEAKSDGKVYADGNGTHGYAAPEQFLPGELLGPETDIYGLAKLLLKAAGEKRLSLETELFLKKCVRTRKEDRPASACRLFRGLLRRYLKQEQIKRLLKKRILRGIRILLTICILSLGFNKMRIQAERAKGSCFLKSGRELWHAEQGTEGKLEACRLFKQALDYEFPEEEDRLEAEAYAELLKYYEGSDNSSSYKVLEAYCSLAEILKKQERPSAEILEVLEELLQVLYMSSDIPDAAYKAAAKKARIYLEDIRKAQPEDTRAEELLHLLAAVEQTRRK